MAILAGDIKLVASRVMDDFDEGGGAPTSTVIADGASNAIFPDISELDRAGGDVSLRKIFIHVQTENRDTYLGSNIIVSEPPTDPNVSVTLFSTRETFDERVDATGRVESYLVAGPEYPGFLLENHIAGQRVIQIFQRPTEAIPNIGQTIILIYREGLSGELIQYVRIIDTSSVIRTYVKANGQTYEAAVVSCDLSDPLRDDYVGSPPSEFFTRAPNSSKIRESSVGDAAVYSGVSETTDAVHIGDIAATVATVFTQLVPSAQTEIPLIDQNVAGVSAAITPSADGTIAYTSSVPFTSTTSLNVGNPIEPLTLVITGAGITLTDSGGQLYDGSTVIGVVDYPRGTISFPTTVAPYNGTKTVTFRPAAAPERVNDTAQVAVTPESRSYNYIVTILPTPAAGSVLVSYRTQGRWYDLRDNGTGVLKGSDAAFGVGSVNYATGTVAVTLGALPDDGSSVMFAWGTKTNYINRAGMSVSAPSVQFQIEDTEDPPRNIAPGSLIITWNNGTARTATDDRGVISGDATGTVDYATGLIKMTPTLLPAGGQTYNVVYAFLPTDDKCVLTLDAGSVPSRELDSTITIDCSDAVVLPSTLPITPGTVEIDIVVALDETEATVLYTKSEYSAQPHVKIRDDGDGNLVDPLGRVAGTVDYDTGILNFQPDGPVLAQTKEYQYVSSSIGYLMSVAG